MKDHTDNQCVRQPPYNIEAEQAVLGALLTENRGIYKIPHLEPEHFYEPLHQRIFEAIRKMVHSGYEATTITLKQRFENDDAVLELKEPNYLAQIAGAASGIISCRNHADLVIDSFKRRQLIELAETACDNAFNFGSEQSTDEILTELSVGCMDISDDRDGVRIKSFYQVTQDIMARMQEDLPCYSTGIASLDESMQGGLHSCKSYCFAARPKNGKTVLLSTISMNLKERNVPHIFVAAEMGPMEIHQRNIARKLGKNSLAFMNERKDSSLIDGIVDYAASETKECWFADAPGMTFDQLRQTVAAAVVSKGVKGVILDYMQLIEGKERRESLVEHHEKITKWIAQVCRKYGIWFLYAAQIKADGSVRGGDATIMAADQLYHLQYDSKYKSAWMEMKATRYTPLMHVGSEHNPALQLDMAGPHFRDIIHNNGGTNVY